MEGRTAWPGLSRLDALWTAWGPGASLPLTSAGLLMDRLQRQGQLDQLQRCIGWSAQ